MAGDWLKIEVALPQKPEVWQIAGILGIDPDAVVGKLLKVWAWFDAHTENGDAPGVTYVMVDAITGRNGFGEAMALCGWLEQDGSILRLPHFDRHNGKTAKNRALTAKRMASLRHKSDAESDADNVTSASAREEKRREEKDQDQKPPQPPASGGRGVRSARKLKAVPDESRFAEFWQAYPRKVAKPAAMKAWAGVAAEAEAIIAGVRLWAGSVEWQKDGGQFIPHPATFLNQRRWEDRPNASADAGEPDHPGYVITSWGARVRADLPWAFT